MFTQAEPINQGDGQPTDQLQENNTLYLCSSP